MTKEEIKHLGNLSRLSLTDTEAEAFTSEIQAILSYVGQVTTLAGSEHVQKVVGPVYNVFREDVVTVEPGSYTDSLLAAAPATQDRFVVVKKIIDQSE